MDCESRNLAKQSRPKGAWFDDSNIQDSKSFKLDFAKTDDTDSLKSEQRHVVLKKGRSFYESQDSGSRPGSAAASGVLTVLHGDSVMTRLLKDLRAIFDTLDSDGNGSVTIAEVKANAQWLHKYYPYLTRYIRTMDADGSGILDFDEFVRFCTSARIRSELRRYNTMTSHDIIRETYKVINSREIGREVYRLRNPLDALRKCEAHGLPCRDIHTHGLRIEWTLYNIQRTIDSTPPGVAIGSPPLDAAGVRGLKMRFWPNGFLTQRQKKLRSKNTYKLVSGWCCIGLFAPVGVYLKMRFFIGDDDISPMKKCYFTSGVITSQLWEPAKINIPDFRDRRDLVVGVEIFENLACARRKISLQLPDISDAKESEDKPQKRIVTYQDAAPNAWYSRKVQQDAGLSEEYISLSGRCVDVRRARSRDKTGVFVVSRLAAASSSST